MYENDSFFGLSQWGQVGLACLSGVLFLVIVFFTWRLLRGRPFWICVPASLLIFWLFVWLSPQIYYMYYRMIIPDLPLQWVIWPPESPFTALRYLFFQGPHNLSAHSQGLLGWWLLLVPFVRRGIQTRV